MSHSDQQLPRIDGATLRTLLDACEPVWLVHAPGAADFRLLHIRDALAFPDADQLRRVLRPEDQIVVYGRDETCTASRTLVRDLFDHSYGRVRWYAAGLQDWVDSGGEVEGVHTDHSATQAPPQRPSPPCGHTD